MSYDYMNKRCKFCGRIISDDKKIGVCEACRDKGGKVAGGAVAGISCIFVIRKIFKAFLSGRK